MTDPKGLSPKQKYEEAEAQLPLLEADYKVIVNKETKTAASKLAKINALKASLPFLKIAANESEFHLSSGCISYLLELWIEVKYGRRKEIKSKYLSKGITQEELSLTMLSKLHNYFYLKNSTRYKNDWIQGEFDTFRGEDPMRAEIIWDVKNAYDIFTFTSNRKSEDVDTNYWWQGQGYMDLLLCDKYGLAYTLNDTPDALYEKEVVNLWWSLGCPDRESDYFISQERALYMNHHYDDIPIEERVIEIKFDRDENAAAKAHERIDMCRGYMQKHFFSNPRFGFEQAVKSILDN
jgi:hypothetical protein